MTITRFKILYYYIFKNKNGMNAKDMIKLFFDKSYANKAKKKISRLTYCEKFVQVFFNGLEYRPLFFPKEFSFKSLEQVVVESFYEDNWHYYEITQTKVSENDIVVDCGAAEGLFSFIIADRCKEIYAIEPLKEFVSCLKRTFSNNKNVHIIEQALSDKEEKLFITSQGISSQISDKKNGNEIEVTTLDKMFFENDIPVSYIKIDLEGYDYHALRGGGKTY